MLSLILNLSIAAVSLFALIAFARRDPNNPRFIEIASIGLPLSAAYFISSLEVAGIALLGMIGATALLLLFANVLVWLCFKSIWRP